MGRFGVGGESPCADGGRRLSEDEEALVQRLLVQAMVDTMLSVAMILAAAFGLHLLILVQWKCCINHSYYNWSKPSNIRVVRISKPHGSRLGIDLHDDKIMHVDLASPCAGLLRPGDQLHVINGKQVLRSRGWIRWLCALLDIRQLWRGDQVAARAAKLLADSSLLYILVSSPPETGTPTIEGRDGSRALTRR